MHRFQKTVDGHDLVFATLHLPYSYLIFCDIYANLVVRYNAITLLLRVVPPSQPV
ncbi:hypothetical protein GALMADRAFT_774380 [Galerina marginata CBS 339.88]|uniref:Uncharacterized protein n=1 Tax=Galerina marginata (strain CBS 339.88) TaxID=685588 RepID=A0A067SZ92_GALM3|nr:hypothetical protein GALMADRAFT_774380 [Galerina marginata CBS 339.88]